MHGIQFSNLPNTNQANLSKFQFYLLNQIELLESEWENFLNPSLSSIPSPFDLPDMEVSINLIEDSLIQKKQILLYGDRDTDGVTATSLLAIYLRRRAKETGANIIAMTSSANDDYGLCDTVQKKISNIKPDLLITLDFGTSNFHEINSLADQGIKVIVLDHHEIPTKIPKCCLINPKRLDSEFGEKKICTAVLSLLLILALESKKNYFQKKEELSGSLFSKIEFGNFLQENETLFSLYKSLLDISSIGTITDMMPLVGFNRVVVKHGLSVISESLSKQKEDRLGFHFLLKDLGLNPEKILSKDIGWSIGPVLNAAGRMGRTETALGLLLSEKEAEAINYSKEIQKLNSERRERTKRNLFKVEEYFKRDKTREDKKIIFCYEPDLEPGVSGIVATKLVEKYKKPVIFITPDNGKARGSIRSYGKENVLHLLEQVSDLLEHFGGHPEAGGFSIVISKIPILESVLEEKAGIWLGEGSKTKDFRSIVSFLPEEISDKLYSDLKIFEPFGQGNPVPILSIMDAEIQNFKPMGDGTHARFQIKGNSKLPFLIWGKAKEIYLLSSKQNKIQLFGNLEENFFRGNTTIQFLVTNFY
ncbi:MAG: single-stranded-DNA-specific exonuclease RecJ [Leptospiraceae bacterium]|nr:single-stranded-DNA-specific exonuclease RecJ [Leptospiraceae bacterium]